MKKHIDLLEVRAQFVPAGRIFGASECETHVVVDGRFVPFDDATDAAEDDLPDQDQTRTQWSAKRDLWALHFRAVGDGVPDDCLLQYEAHAEGWEDMLDGAVRAMGEDIAAIVVDRVLRARTLKAPYLSDADRTRAHDALAAAAQTEPLTFLAAVEVQVRGAGEEQTTSVAYLGRVDCSRLGQAVFGQPDLAETVRGLSLQLAGAVREKADLAARLVAGREP